MNVFEALSQGNGSINEENISSFLAYLLDPQKDHGLRKTFLSKFIDIVVNTDKDKKHMMCLDTQILLEKTYGENKKDSIRTDIEIIFSKHKKNKYKICIENKIKIESKDKENHSKQLQNEYNSIVEDNVDNAKIFMVYLTPEHNDFKDIFDLLNIYKTKNEKKHIKWNEILELLNSILNENKLSTPPITDYVRYTLQSFLYYMNKNVLIKSKFFELDNNIYELKKISEDEFQLYRIFENGKECHVLIHKDNPETKDNMTQIFIKKIIEKGEEPEKYTNGNIKQTDGLARQLWKLLDDIEYIEN